MRQDLRFHHNTEQIVCLKSLLSFIARGEGKNDVDVEDKNKVEERVPLVSPYASTFFPPSAPLLLPFFHAPLSTPPFCRYPPQRSAPRKK